MWSLKLEPNVGWIVVDQAGEPLEVDGAVTAYFTPEAARAMADSLMLRFRFVFQS